MIATRLAPRFGLQAASTSRLAALPRSRTFASTSAALANSLLYLEHREGALNPASLVALSAAKKVGGDIHAIVAGDQGVKEAADKASK